MEYLLNFFEDLDEMVYISDMETNELVYMNRHLRDALGFENHAQYQGQMCYKVLQGYDQPCSFCTNHILEPNHFHSWTHINPVMNKRFLIKDSVFYYDDRKYRIEIAIDVDSEVVCQTPYYYARSESILNGCLQQAFSDASPEAALGQILSYVGRTFSCDRVYIFELDGDSANNTYEWCDPSAAPQQEILQNLPISFISWWIDLFEKNELVMIRDGGVPARVSRCLCSAQAAEDRAVGCRTDPFGWQAGGLLRRGQSGPGYDGADRFAAQNDRLFCDLTAAAQGSAQASEYTQLP